MMTLLHPVLLVLATLFTTPGFARPFESAQRDSPTIKWGDCPKEVLELAPGLEKLQCATHSVPLDWGHHHSGGGGGGDKIELGMARLPATDPANRIGNLFINPGGPGGSGVQLIGEIELGEYGYFSEEIRARFDIIGIDPRGIGLSTPVKCDPDLWNKRVSLFPDTEESYRNMVDHYAAVYDSCRKLTGPLIEHVDTINVAKDLEAVRVALDDEPMNWLGLSYGTQIGYQYAELFPHNIRSMILDGVLQRSQDESAALLTESTTYEATLKQFFEWCEGNSSCPLEGQDVSKVWDTVAATAAKSPIPAPSCNDTTCRSTVNAEEFRFSAQPQLTKIAKWPALASGLHNASQGDASAFAAQLTTGSDIFSDTGLWAGLAVECQEWSHATKSLAGMQAKAMQGAAFAPFTRGNAQSYTIQTSCIGWKAPLTNPPKPANVTGTPRPLLLVNAKYDPETSYVWAVGVQGEIGRENAVLLTRDGVGHTSYSLGGDTSKAMDKYIINLTLPEAGTVYKS